MIDDLNWRLRRTRPAAVAWVGDLQWDATVAPRPGFEQHAVCESLQAELAGAAVGWVRDSGAVIESLPATVPGTVAGALRAAGLQLPVGDHRHEALTRNGGADPAGHQDDFDWWWCTELDFSDLPGHHIGQRSDTWRLRLSGVATVSEIFWDGRRVAHSVSGLDDVVVDLADSAGRHQLALVCRAPSLVPVPRKPRPRWRSTLVADSSVRWRRTPLIGRIPWPGTCPVVGPWGEASLEPVAMHGVELLSVRSTVELAVPLSDSDGPVGTPQSPIGGVGSPGGNTGSDDNTGTAGGQVHLVLRLTQPAEVRAACGGDNMPAATGQWLLPAGEHTVVLPVADPVLWWPATHGQPVLHQLTLAVRAHDQGPWQTVEQRQVGFRHITAETHDGGFALVVNGRKIFARGAVWSPVDPFTLGGDPAEIDRMVRAMRAAGANVLRVSGTHAWEQRAFYQACDRHGLLVWQDAMMATLDPPSDPQWLSLVEAELRTWWPRLGAHPSVAVFSGGNEVLQQPVLWGRDLESIQIPVLQQLIPELSAALAPQVLHVLSSPCGGTPATRPDTGISHWFGVGAYRRPLTDTRSSGVRFAAEALAFGVPPAASEIAAAFGSDTAEHNDDARASWRSAAAKDPGATWDFEDTTVHYARRWLEPGLDADSGAAGATAQNDEPGSERVECPSWRDLTRAEQLQAERVAAANAVEHTLTELRRDASRCDGVVILASRDLTAGAGWGLTDHTGRPKSTWYAMRRACADTTVRFVDEGLSGLHIHVFHDRCEPFTAMMEIRTWTRHGAAGPSARVPVDMPTGGQKIWNVEQELGGFLDLTHAWGFGEPQWEAVAVEIIDDQSSTSWPQDTVRSLRDVRLLGGGHRNAGADLRQGLALSQRDGCKAHGRWQVGALSSRSAVGVSVDAGPGVVAEDDVMILGPGEKREITVVTAGDWPMTPVRPGRGKND